MQQAAIDLCWRATQSASQMTSLALPPKNHAYFAFLSISVTRNQSEPANELWRTLIGLNLKVSHDQLSHTLDIGFLV